MRTPESDQVFAAAASVALCELLQESLLAPELQGAAQGSVPIRISRQPHEGEASGDG